MAGTASLGADPSAGELAAPLLAPGQRVDAYAVERVLGEGGGGVVYLARHVELDGARFALKVLRPQPGQSADRLAREGRLAALVRSAHVVKVAGMGWLPGGPAYLAMEYVEGPTLEALLGGRTLDDAEALSVGRQLCLALEAAAAERVVHGDVSWRNVFVTPQPDGSLHVQLGDFGLARHQSGPGSATVSLELGAVSGTPRFMAPETITGEGGRDPRTDLYAVGVILYRLLAGEFPFDGATTHEILAATLRGQPTPLRQRRPELGPVADVVMRCLELTPARRPESARALREALEAAARGELADEASTSPSSARPRSWVWVAALGGFLASAGGLAYARWAPLELGPTLHCPDTTGAAVDAELAPAIARALCVRVGAEVDVDWGGGPGSTAIRTALEPYDGRLRLRAEVEDRVVVVDGDAPLAMVREATAALLRELERPTMGADEVRRWGARDVETAVAVRTVLRRRAAVIIEDFEQEPRAVLARDPDLPLMHLVLAEVERDSNRRDEARRRALETADRLPPERAEALRGFLAVQAARDAPDAGLEQLRRAYNARPDDPDVGVLYASALARAGRDETVRSVAEALHARFPRRALMAVHHASGTADREATKTFLAWIGEALPELRGSSTDIGVLLAEDRLAEAEDRLAFLRRLGADHDGVLISEAMVALAVGEPARIDRTALRLQGSPRTWSSWVGMRMRFAGLLATGRAEAAAAVLDAQRAAEEARGDGSGALWTLHERVKASRLTGVARPADAVLVAAEARADDAALSVGTYAALRAELALARASGPALGAALGDLEAKLGARAQGSRLLSARLRAIALVRAAQGADAAAALAREAAALPIDERAIAGLEGGRAFEAIGALDEAEAAYRLAARPLSLERHAFESLAARAALADLLERRGRGAEVPALRARVDRALVLADPGLRARLSAR
jgi:hypothetical protein